MSRLEVTVPFADLLDAIKREFTSEQEVKTLLDKLSQLEALTSQIRENLNPILNKVLWKNYLNTALESNMYTLKNPMVPNEVQWNKISYYFSQNRTFNGLPNRCLIIKYNNIIYAYFNGEIVECITLECI